MPSRLTKGAIVSEQPTDRTTRRLARRFLLSTLALTGLVGSIGTAISAASPIWGS